MSSLGNELQKVISELNLSPFVATVLEELAKDAHGVVQEAAPSMIASVTNHSIDESSQAIIELFGRNLLLRVDNDNDTRIVVNYELLGISNEVRFNLFLIAQAFEIIGAPHSPKAMSTLDLLFREEKRPIYLGLEVTSYKVFRELESRADARRHTIFLMPKKSSLPSERQLHYDEVLNEWKNFLKNGPTTLRQYVKILITPRPFPYLYTSSLGPEFARMDLYYYNDSTTRRGEMVQANKGSSFYNVIYDSYCRATYYSAPLLHVWPIEYFQYWIKRYWISTSCLSFAFLLSFYDYSIAQLLSTLGIGISGNAIYENLRCRNWNPPNLYKNV